MEVEVGIAPFVVHKEYVSCFWVCTSGNFNQSGLKSLFRAIFDKKRLNFEIFSLKIKSKMSTILFGLQK